MTQHRGMADLFAMRILDFAKIYGAYMPNSMSLKTVAVVVMLGGISVAVARQPAEPNSKAGFTATLANGVAVELVGVCDYPSKGQWWKPDGSPFLTSLVDGFDLDIMSDADTANSRKIQIVMKLRGTDAENIEISQVNGQPLWGCGRQFKDGIFLKDFSSVAFLCPASMNSIDLKFNIKVKKIAADNSGVVEFKNVSLRPWVKRTRQEVIDLFSAYVNKKSGYSGGFEFCWSDIPVLLELAKSDRVLKWPPCSPASSYAQEKGYEGMVALWIIERLRQKELGVRGAGPLNPICGKGNVGKLKTEWETSPEIHTAVLWAYQDWWQRAAYMPAKTAASIDPLEATDLWWYGSFKPKPPVSDPNSLPPDPQSKACPEQSERIGNPKSEIESPNSLTAGQSD